MSIKTTITALALLLASIVHTLALADGMTLYKQACYTCHDSGLVNAPRLGDKAAWLPRVNKGVKLLSETVINGKGAMPPRGGTQYSDNQIKQVINFMLSKVK